MGLVTTIRIKCPACRTKARFSHHRAVDSIREPELKTKILDGSICDFVCQACHASTMVQTDLLYADLSQQLMIFFAAAGPLPRDPGSDLAALGGAELAKMTTRMVTDYLDLVEKITAFDAHLDDRVLEVLKRVIRSPAGTGKSPALPEVARRQRRSPGSDRRRPGR